MPSAVIHITKQAAAERQLRAAIRLYFAEEDGLAVHTVAAAAFQLISDLLDKRGHDVAADHYLTSIFYVVRDFRRGTLPPALLADHEFLAWVVEASEQLPIKANTRLEDVQVSVSASAKKAFWDQRHKVPNFLKHADRDQRGHIAVEDVDNLLLLMQAFGAYSDLSKTSLGNEGLVFQTYVSAINAAKQTATDSDATVAKIASLPEEHRRHLCAALIKELDASDAGAA